MPSAPVLTARVLQKSTLTVTELKCDQRGFGKTASMPRENAWLIALQLRACPDHDLYFEGRRTRPENYVEGVTSIYDLRRDPVADIRDPFHSLMFHLPHAALNRVTEGSGVSRVGDLRHKAGVSVDDPVIRGLLSTLLPAVANPREVHPLFLDHVALALTVHVASVYGGMSANTGIPRGGLAPWQERRAKDLMMACINEEIPLERLAAECGLSVRHFARAFRKSVGVPPHRWLLQQRVTREGVASGEVFDAGGYRIFLWLCRSEPLYARVLRDGGHKSRFMAAIESSRNFQKLTALRSPSVLKKRTSGKRACYLMRSF